MHKYEFIVPLYNCEKFLDDFFLSLIKQDNKDFSILICDDCSTDSSLDIVYQYFNRLKIRIIQNDKNMGLIFTLNKLINNSDSDVLMRIDPDDYISPSRVSDIVNAFESNTDLDIFFSNYRLVDTYNNPIKNKHLFQPFEVESLKFVSCFNSPIPHACSSYKKNFIQNFAYNNSYVAAEDFALWSEILKENNLRIIYSGKTDYYYRINSESETSLKNESQLKNHIKLIQSNQITYLGKELTHINKNYFSKQIIYEDIIPIVQEFDFIKSFVDSSEKKLYLTDIIIFFASKMNFYHMLLLLVRNMFFIKYRRLLYWVLR